MAAILVTGGAGFIGSHLSIKLKETGHDVTVLDNLDPYYPVELKRKNILISEKTGCRFIEGDITDKKLVDELVSDIDFIYHLAARPGVRASIENPQIPNRVNIQGTLILLEASLESNIKRFINASSSSVYGKVKYLPFDEDHPTQPISPYAVSKLVAEHYCRVFFEIHGLPTVSLRYFTVYGPRMRPDLAIPIFTKKILDGEEPVVFGDGEQTRDFTFIDDIVQGNMGLLESSNVDGQILNIGSGNRLTVNRLLEILERILNKDIKPKYIQKMKGDAQHTLANVDKAKKLMGYQPKTQIEEGLKKFVNWFGDGSFYEI
jgi:UDP-glucose 4-epimerase